MTRFMAVAAATFLVTAGCSKESPQSATADSRTSPSLAPAIPDRMASRSVAVDSLRDDFVKNGLLVPDTRAAVLIKLGQPDSAHTHPLQNRHNTAQTDSIVDLYFPGLHLRYYIVTKGATEFLTNADVANNRYLKYPQLGIGASRSRIALSLGEPVERGVDKDRYDCASCMGGDSPVYFHFTGNVVKSLEYSFYLD